jgi:hypothetical protein
MDFPVVINSGSLYVTKGSERRSSGTYYTPPSLTEPIVKHALDPLVYIGPAEGLPETEWKLKSAKEILDLKICDMAMGSGAFLVQVCRYLAEKLVGAWEDAEAKNPGTFVVTPDGDLSTGSAIERLLPVDADERILIARRYVADKCIYGVDKNELAVNMAKLSLWLITLQRDRPFTFLDHALKCGDSLLGVSSLSQIENFSLRSGEQQITFATANLFRYVEEASKKRRQLEALPSNTYTQIETKDRLHAEAEAATAKVKAIADCLVAFELRGLYGDSYENERTRRAEHVQLLMKRDAEAKVETSNPRSELAQAARENLQGHGTFHWPIEFPEVFGRGGFDAFVGNPPFMGGKRISTTFGDDYAEILSLCFPPATKNVDLCGYFHMRSCMLLFGQGYYGLVSTERILVGDSKTSCLDVLSEQHGRFFKIIESMPWPGHASVTIAILYFTQNVPPTVSPEEESLPFLPLSENAGKSFVGCAIQGLGFVLEPNEVAKANISGEAEVVRPFLISDDLNNCVGSVPKRSIVFFGGMSLSEARAYPICVGIVEQRVKPYRDTVKRKAHRDSWWQYGDRRPGLFSAISKLKRVLVVGLTSKYLAFEFVPANYVYDQTTVVVASDSYTDFAMLSSSVHLLWALKFGANLGGTPRYNPSRCFVPFPFPREVATLGGPGERYHKMRFQIMQSRQEALTKTYNRFHDRSEMSEDIAQLRAFHRDVDQAVAAAYGWRDLDLGHGFHATKQGERFTINESARREVLDRLLQLNHERYDEERRFGLHDKKSGKTKKKGNSVLVTKDAKAGQGKLQLSS